MNVSYDEMADTFTRVLKRTGFSVDRAALLGRLFADSTRDGVPSHGINRFPGFNEQMRKGQTDLDVLPELVGHLGIIEQFDGRMGVGPLNAHFCMGRAIALAKLHGIGCAALRNTNHWMRPGAYGLQAADEQCIGICWTNTTQFMPLWGSMDPKVGSNPLVIAVPREEGTVMLDMALSQFSMGRLAIHRQKTEPLPVPGGYDTSGQLTTDPEFMAEGGRPLPIGYWKGAGLSVMLDLIAALLSGGNSALQIAQLGAEISVSQVFLVFDLEQIVAQEDRREMVDAVIRDLQESTPVAGGVPPRYPGEGMLAKRKENLEKGIEIDDSLWDSVLSLLG
ncbi:MAG: 3-dehydro-L-gulonate 2-dehydrogenase [Gemmatimonadetes bacterium]|jgi:3-dehydro-L-gulonate 2-dehydrogenase|nr:3-dehydro-L-gulonate 2-dehydrogenase [Gemmatimonadota bacterium]HCK12373.1 3-dehydro-L-gulonate 2-dehydrogenase [Candidatus Latescibacterota bacterium]